MTYRLLLAVAAVTPTANPAPHLRLDVERHVTTVLERPGLPRFETTVEVVGQTPQEMFEKHLQGFDALCGPGGGGAPTVADMAPLLNHRLPSVFPTVSVFGALDALKKTGVDRYYVYRMEGHEGVRFLLHEGRLPIAQLVLPGAVLEPVAAFPDSKTAAHAVWRLEHGFKTAEAPPPPRCK
jgi:hypothetical protein